MLWACAICGTAARDVAAEDANGFFLLLTHVYKFAYGVGAEKKRTREKRGKEGIVQGTKDKHTHIHIHTHTHVST